MQVGEERITERGWPLLGSRVGYVHIKDCKLNGSVKAAGKGDGQIPELLARLISSGYQGMLALEPHLAIAAPQQRVQRPGGHGLRRGIAAEGDACNGGGGELSLY